MARAASQILIVMVMVMASVIKAVTMSRTIQLPVCPDALAPLEETGEQGR